MSQLWLYLHFPRLQLNSLTWLADQSEYAEQPLVILNTQSNKVLQLNRQASLAGIKPNMGLATSASLAHDLLVHPYKQEIEQAKLAEIAEALYQVTSDICLYPPDGLLLRVHNMLH